MRCHFLIRAFYRREVVVYTTSVIIWMSAHNLFLIFNLAIFVESDHSIYGLFSSRISWDSMISQLHDSFLTFFTTLAFHNERFSKMLICLVNIDNQICYSRNICYCCRTDGSKYSMYIRTLSVLFFRTKKALLKEGIKKDLAACYCRVFTLSSPLWCLTSVFGMGTGGPSP